MDAESHEVDPAIPPVDEGGPAEAVASTSLSYSQLVMRRFRRNAYGMTGLIICLLIMVIAIFPGFLAPYGPTTANSRAIYSPPQLVRVIAPEGGLSRPHVLGVSEEMDMTTFEITFVPDPEQRADLALFVKGDEWKLFGMTFNRHLFGTTDGQRIHLLGTDGLGRDIFSRMLYGTRITLLMGFLVMLAAGIIGSIMGVSSGYFGGLYDLFVQRLVEFIKSFPDLPLYLVLVSLLPRRADATLIFIMFAGILVLLGWADVSRELRGKVMSMRGLEYVRAAEAVGAGSGTYFVTPPSTECLFSYYRLGDVFLAQRHFARKLFVIPGCRCASTHGELGQHA